MAITIPQSLFSSVNFCNFFFIPITGAASSAYFLWWRHHQIYSQQILLSGLFHLHKDWTSGLLSCDQTQEHPSSTAGALLSLQHARSHLAPLGSVLLGVPESRDSQSISPENKPLWRVGRAWITLVGCHASPHPEVSSPSSSVSAPPPSLGRHLTNHRNVSLFLPFPCLVALHFTSLLTSQYSSERTAKWTVWNGPDYTVTNSYIHLMFRFHSQYCYLSSSFKHASWNYFQP